MGTGRDSSERPEALARVSKDLRAPRAAGVAGLIFAVLFIGVLMLVRTPLVASGEALSSWYEGGAQSRVVFAGLYAIPLAGIAFLWFIGSVRERIGDKEDRLFATVFLGSGLLFVAMLFVAAAVASAMALRFNSLGQSAKINPETAQFVQALTATLLYVYAARAAGVFMMVTSTIALRTKTIPRWVAFLGFAVALLLLLSITRFQLIMTLFPLWVALLSVLILVTPPGGSDAAQAAAPGVDE